MWTVRNLNLKDDGHITSKTLWDGAKCLNKGKLEALNIYFKNG